MAVSHLPIVYLVMSQSTSICHTSIAAQSEPLIAPGSLSFDQAWLHPKAKTLNIHVIHSMCMVLSACAGRQCLIHAELLIIPATSL